MFMRVFSIAVGVAALIGEPAPPTARAETCPCASNSPVINPFPFKWIRWGTSRVLSRPAKCGTDRAGEPAIAISEIDPADSTTVRGYQLIVVDLSNNKLLCKGTDLTGVEFVLSQDVPLVMIQQIARTQITRDEADLNKSGPTEHRLVYDIADVRYPNDSICTQGLEGTGLFRRQIRRVARYKTVVYPPSQPSSLDDLWNVLPDQLANYAVIIPDAEYTDNVVPQTPPSERLRKLRIPAGYDYDGNPKYPAGQSSTTRSRMEWFEYACASGALAHTELRGLVDVSTSLPETRKVIRTAALRMFSATYQHETAETVSGVPITFTRITANAPIDPCPSSKTAGLIEARWDDLGATCLSHSRLWMKDTVIMAPHQATPATSESDFRATFGLSTCDVPDKKATSNTRTPYFTSCALNHINHSGEPSIGVSRR